MNTVKSLAICFLFISAAYAEVTCQSTPAASCLSEDGMCVEYFEGEMGDEEMWEGMCEQMNGTYTASACDQSLSVLKCLIKSNPVTPVMHFLKPFEAEQAKSACTMMQGKVCL